MICQASEASGSTTAMDDCDFEEPLQRSSAILELIKNEQRSWIALWIFLNIVWNPGILVFLLTAFGKHDLLMWIVAVDMSYALQLKQRPREMQYYQTYDHPCQGPVMWRSMLSMARSPWCNAPSPCDCRDGKNPWNRPRPGPAARVVTSLSSLADTTVCDSQENADVEKFVNSSVGFLGIFRLQMGPTTITTLRRRLFSSFPVSAAIGWWEQQHEEASHESTAEDLCRWGWDYVLGQDLPVGRTVWMDDFQKATCSKIKPRLLSSGCCNNFCFVTPVKNSAFSNFQV